jgi:hypothetical protein
MRQDYTSRAVKQNRICRQHVLCVSTQIDTKTKVEFCSEFQKIVDVHHELLDTFSRTKMLTKICYMSDKVIQIPNSHSTRNTGQIRAVNQYLNQKIANYLRP